MSKQTQEPGPIIKEHFLDSMQYKMIQGGKSCGKSFINKILQGYELKIHDEVSEINEDQVKQLINERKHFDHLFCSNFKAIHESKTSKNTPKG